MMDFTLWELVDSKFRESDIHGAIAMLEERLAQMQGSHFKGLIGAQFTNSPVEVLEAINNFIEANQEEFLVQAIYLDVDDGLSMYQKR